MGQIYSVYDQIYDPGDSGNPQGAYAAYVFTNDRLEMTSALTRRQGVVSIPDADDVLDYYALRGGPIGQRMFEARFRLLTHGQPDAAIDNLMIAIRGGDEPVRLVWKTDLGGFWYTVGHLDTIDPAYTVDRDYFVDVRVVWRIRADWRQRYSIATGDIWGINDGVWGTADGNWGSLGVTTFAASPQLVTVDLRGTAGLDLPTLDETGPVFTLTGTMGGTLGVRIESTTAFYTDTNGSRQPYAIVLPVQLPTVGDQAVLNCATRSFTADGLPLASAAQRPQRNTPAQPEWMRLKKGVINSFNVTNLGTGGVTGGQIKVDGWKKRG